jgi:hypothetical protein
VHAGHPARGRHPSRHRRNPARIITVFAANAAGSALVLLTLAVAAAVANTALSAVLGRVAPRVSGALLAASGAYLLAYWLPHLDGSIPTQRSGLDHISARATSWISGHQSLVASAALLVIAAAALGATLTRRRIRQPDDCCETTTGQARVDEPATVTQAG